MFGNTGAEVIKVCTKERIQICEYVVRCEEEESGLLRSSILEKMKRNLKVMKESSEYGFTHSKKSVSGLIGGDAKKVYDYMNKGNTITGKYILKAIARALSCAEVNASMGKIVAAPTAGSCGILPAVILTAGERFNKTEDEMVQALFTASGVGIIIAKNATLSGAEGGCQAECGSAAAMGAAAVVEMMGGSPKASFDAASIVIKNVLGLVCDPIAGLVESPCAKRNAGCTVLALSAADMAMSGIESIIPFDECVQAMAKVGRTLPCELRETAEGGLAVTKTGLKLQKKILGH